MENKQYIEMYNTETSHWWFVGRRKIINTFIKNHISKKNNLQILEAGCGTGGNLELLSNYGTLFAFEKEPGALDKSIFTSKQINKKILLKRGSFPDDIPFDDNQFDLVCILDVLEHIEDDENALAKLRSKLKPGGYLLITVPAYQWLWSQHDEMNHHKRRYNSRSLKKVINKNNFDYIKLTYFNSILFPIAAFVRLLNLEKNLSNNPKEFKPGIINSLLKNIFLIENYLLKFFNFPFGLSIICILKKI